MLEFEKLENRGVGRAADGQGVAAPVHRDPLARPGHHRAQPLGPTGPLIKVPGAAQQPPGHHENRGRKCMQGWVRCIPLLLLLPGSSVLNRASLSQEPNHQQPEVNYLPRFSPQWISLEY